MTDGVRLRLRHHIVGPGRERCTPSVAASCVEERWSASLLLLASPLIGIEERGSAPCAARDRQYPRCRSPQRASAPPGKRGDGGGTVTGRS